MNYSRFRLFLEGFEAEMFTTACRKDRTCFCKMCQHLGTSVSLPVSLQVSETLLYFFLPVMSPVLGVGRGKTFKPSGSTKLLLAFSDRAPAPSCTVDRGQLCLHLASSFQFFLSSHEHLLLCPTIF